MLTTSSSAYARALACERCAVLLSDCQDPAFADAETRTWLTKLLTDEGATWRSVATAREREAARAVASDGAPKATLPLTDRMVEALTDMSNGAKVVSEPCFSWPRWEVGPRNSRGCPTCAMLKGMHERGLLTVQKERRKWVIEINDSGRQALVAYAVAKKAKKPSAFKSFLVSYCVNGGSRSTSDRTTARTEEEAIKRKLRALKSRDPMNEYTDLQIVR